MRYLILLTTSLLLIQAASATDNLAELERQLLGQQQPTLSNEQRIHRLESTFQTPPPVDLSPSARVEWLYAMHQQLASAGNEQEARQAYNRGIDAATAGQYEQAIQAYRQAIHLDPNLLAAYNNLAHLLQETQHYEEALQVYQQALSRWPQEPLLHRNQGIVQEKAGHIEQALQSFETYLKLAVQPDPPIQAIVENIRRHHTLLDDSGDYIAATTSATKGQELIWPKDRNPIRIYVQAADAGSIVFSPLVQSCTREWEHASNERLRIIETGNASLADIWITLQPGPYHHPTEDVAHAQYDATLASGSGPMIRRVYITVNTGEPGDASPISQRMDRIRPLILHELGHALGIWGHSPHPKDVMYMHPLVTSLSQRDVRTLQALYRD